MEGLGYVKGTFLLPRQYTDMAIEIKETHGLAETYGCNLHLLLKEMP